MKNGTSLNEAWAGLTILFLLAGYFFHLSGWILLAGLLGTVFGLAWLWSRLALEGVAYHRRLHFHKGFAGETTDCEITVENRKRLPLLWLRIRDEWPRSVAPTDEGLLSTSHREEVGIYTLMLPLRGRARTRRHFNVTFRRRGVYQIGPAEAVSGDPFGLFAAEAPRITPAQRVVVFPRLRDATLPDWSADDPFGEKRSPRPLFQDPNRSMGARDYRPEDGFRRIHWPATARVGQLQTRVFEPVRGLDMVVALNASTFEHYWEGTNPEVLEALIEIAARLVADSFEAGFRVGLISNGSLAHAGQALSIAPGRSTRHMPHMLEALAALTPLVTSPFERVLLKQAGKLEYGSAMLIVTAVVTPALMEAMLKLRLRSRRTVLIYLGKETPMPVEGIRILHHPLPEVDATR